jgi:hypothetical protein
MTSSDSKLNCLSCNKSGTLVQLPCQHIFCPDCLRGHNGDRDHPEVKCPYNACGQSVRVEWLYSGLKSDIWRPFGLETEEIERQYQLFRTGQLSGGIYTIHIAGAERIIDYHRMLQINKDTRSYRRIIRLSQAGGAGHADR